MPEFYNGKNVADFIDPDIAEKLEALEREEEALEEQGFYASDEEEMVSLSLCITSHNTDDEQIDSEEEEFRDAAKQVKTRKDTIKKLSQEKNKYQNTPLIPRKKKHVSLSEFTHGMRKMGHDPSVLERRAKRLMDQKKEAWDASEVTSTQGGTPSAMDVDVDMDNATGSDLRAALKERKALSGGVTDRTPRKNRQLAGLATVAQSEKAHELRNFAQREPNRLAKASESDRHIPITRPKWMLAGKRKGGKTDRR
jgi:nucleolar GTP-binding protein